MYGGGDRPAAGGAPQLLTADARSPGVLAHAGRPDGTSLRLRVRRRARTRCSGRGRRHGADGRTADLGSAGRRRDRPRRHDGASPCSPVSDPPARSAPFEQRCAAPALGTERRPGSRASARRRRRRSLHDPRTARTSAPCSRVPPTTRRPKLPDPAVHPRRAERAGCAHLPVRASTVCGQRLRGVAGELPRQRRAGRGVLRPRSSPTGATGKLSTCWRASITWSRPASPIPRAWASAAGATAPSSPTTPSRATRVSRRRTSGAGQPCNAVYGSTSTSSSTT